MSTTVTRSPQDEFQESSSDDEDGPQRLQRAKDHQLPPQGEQKIVQVAGAKSEERAARDLSLRAIMAEHLPVESWGPALHDSLHEPLKQMWLAPLDKAVVAATAAKYEIPANAKYLRVQRTNTEVFGLANGPGKAQDAALQSRQDTLLKAATATSQALSGLMAIPKGEPLEDGALERIFQQLWDSMSLLAYANNEVVRDRKGKLARALPEQYRGLRTASFPESEMLFGEDPAGLLDQLTKDHRRSQGWRKESNKPRSGHKFNKNGGHGDRGKENVPWYKRKGGASKNSRSRAGDRRTKDPKDSKDSTKKKSRKHDSDSN